MLRLIRISSFPGQGGAAVLASDFDESRPASGIERGMLERDKSIRRNGNRTPTEKRVAAKQPRLVVFSNLVARRPPHDH